MKISELISALEKAKSEHGNLEVEIETDGLTECAIGVEILPERKGDNEFHDNSRPKSVLIQWTTDVSLPNTVNCEKEAS